MYILRVEIDVLLKGNITRRVVRLVYLRLLVFSENYRVFHHHEYLMGCSIGMAYCEFYLKKHQGNFIILFNYEAHTQQIFL